MPQHQFERQLKTENTVLINFMKPTLILKKSLERVLAGVNSADQPTRARQLLY